MLEVPQAAAGIGLLDARRGGAAVLELLLSAIFIPQKSMKRNTVAAIQRRKLPKNNRIMITAIGYSAS